MADDKMKPEWTDYPLGLFLSATRSTAGGLLTLTIALCVGTQLGLLALEGDLDLPTCFLEWVFFVVCFLGPISLACLALWGFIYVVFLAWIGHLLIHRDASRLKMGASIVFPQYTCTVITMGAMTYFDTPTVLRLCVATPLIFLISASPYLVEWRRGVVASRTVNPKRRPL